MLNNQTTQALLNVVRDNRDGMSGSEQDAPSAAPEVTPGAPKRTPRPSLSPLSRKAKPSAVDLAWAAGLLDGEGCICLARQTYLDPRRRPTFSLRVYVCQNNIGVLQEFAWAVGVPGRIYTLARTLQQNRDCHSLVYHGVGAFEVLQRLLPHLRRKGPEARVALEFRRRCHIHRKYGPKGCPKRIWELREWYYRKLQAMK